MNVIGNPYAQEILRRFWRIPAATPIAPTVAPEIVPTFEVGKPPIEIASLGGWLPCVGSGESAAVAGQYSRITFGNLTSDRLMVLEGVYLGSTAMACRFGLGLTAPVQGRVGPRDSRYAAARPQAQIGAAASAGLVLTSGFGRCTIAAGFAAFPVGEWVLAPTTVSGGTAVIFEGETVNAQISATFFWRERLIGPASFEVTGL